MWYVSQDGKRIADPRKIADAANGTSLLPTTPGRLHPAKLTYNLARTILTDIYNNMANPEKNIWRQRALAGVEIAGAGLSFLNMVKAFVNAGFSPAVAIWGGLGLLFGTDAKNRLAKTNT